MGQSDVATHVEVNERTPLLDESVVVDEALQETEFHTGTLVNEPVIPEDDSVDDNTSSSRAEIISHIVSPTLAVAVLTVGEYSIFFYRILSQSL
jgi:hypothetical protein